MLRCCERAGALYVEQLELYQRDEEFSKHLIYPQKEAAWYWLMDALDLELPVILRNLNREAKTLDASEATPDASEAAPDNWEATPEFKWIIAFLRVQADSPMRDCLAEIVPG